MKAPFRFGPASLLAALVLAATFAATAAAQPTPAGSRWIAVHQNLSIAIDLAAASGGEQLAGRTVVVVPPRHGRFAVLGQVATYSPDSGYFGRDSVTLDDGAATVTLELRILPEIVPLAGRFTETREAAALYDQGKESFLICSAEVEDDEPLDCQWIPLARRTGKALLPLAWPHKSGYDLPALFDLAAGELRILAFVGSSLVEQQRLLLPEAVGAWPVMGDWGGLGERELALVFESGEVMSLRNGSWLPWPAALEAKGDDNLLWPIRFPRPDEPDALALVEQSYGHLGWLGLDASGEPVQGFEPGLRTGNFQKPVVWDMAPNSSTAASPEIFFLAPDRLELVPGGYSMGKPQTIPVKFPDDPPGP